MAFTKIVVFFIIVHSRLHANDVVIFNFIDGGAPYLQGEVNSPTTANKLIRGLKLIFQKIA